MNADRELCERVASAVADGRFLEDPALWRAHVETCDVCRPLVEGLFTLRTHVERASLEVVPAPASSSGEVQRAFRRYRRGRWNRGLAVGCAAALAATAVFLAVSPAKPPPVAESPAEYANRLLRRVFPVSGPADTALLRNDAAARAEYVRALDHPSSVVRRVALQALVFSSVEVDAARLSRALLEFREDLQVPLSVAAASSGEREVASALNARRGQTVQTALTAALIQSSQGKPSIHADSVAQFLGDSDPILRAGALAALAADPSYVPGEDVVAMMRTDPDVTVRAEAVACLVLRSGDAGAEQVVGRLTEHPDPELEIRVAPLLGRRPLALPLARLRVADPKTPIELALAYALVIVRSGDRAVPEALVEAAFKTPGADALRGLALLASQGDWTTLRSRLQDAWRRAPAADAADAGLLLARWDVAGTDPARLHLALDICEAQRGAQAKRLVQLVAKTVTKDVRERAEALLASWPAN